jgi:hypothetical protein
MKLERTTEFTGTLSSADGSISVPYKADVSPCCWMYPHYGLQIGIYLQDGGKVHAHTKDVTFSEATLDNAHQLIAKVKLCSCSLCGEPAIDPSTASTNRGGKCEKCFIKALDEEFKADLAKQEARLRKQDAKQKAKGFTHRIEAWIHPANGDDFQISVWMVNPTTEAIQSVLKKQKSTVLTDYQLIEL